MEGSSQYLQLRPTGHPTGEVIYRWLARPPGGNHQQSCVRPCADFAMAARVGRCHDRRN